MERSWDNASWPSTGESNTIRYLTTHRQKPVAGIGAAHNQSLNFL